MGSNPNSAAQVAAKWWADLLAEAEPINAARAAGAKDENAKKLQGPFAAAREGEQKVNLTPQRINAFREGLAKLIQMSLKSVPNFEITVDYDPDPLLKAAAQKAGIDLGQTLLPWRTRMIVRNEKLTVITNGQLKEIPINT